MNDIVIEAENIGEMYTIGHQAEKVRYVALRDVLMQNARNLWNKTKNLAKGNPSIRNERLCSETFAKLYKTSNYVIPAQHTQHL